MILDAVICSITLHTIDVMMGLQLAGLLLSLFLKRGQILELLSMFMPVQLKSTVNFLMFLLNNTLFGFPIDFTLTAFLIFC